MSTINQIPVEINSELIHKLDAIIEAIAKTNQLRARQLVALRSDIKRLERVEKKYKETYYTKSLEAEEE